MKQMDRWEVAPWRDASDIEILVESLVDEEVQVEKYRWKVFRREQIIL